MSVGEWESCVLPIVFSKLNKNFSKQYDEILKPYGLSKFHAFYLIYLHKYTDGLTLGDCNRLIGCDKANTSRAVADLESKSMINRLYANEGEKKYLIALTEKGREISQKFIESTRGFAKTMLDKITLEEQKLLLNIINKMCGDEKC